MERHDLTAPLNKWYRTPLGQRLLHAEQAQLNAVLPSLFGYHLLQVGGLPDRRMTESSLIRHQIMLTDRISPHVVLSPLSGRADALPLLSGQIDLVLLVHALEAARDPRQVLREAYRVLIPEGHLVITGLNPWSGWGAWRRARAKKQKMPWKNPFLSVSRLREWLTLLGCEVVTVRRFFFRPPVLPGGVFDQFTFLDNMGSRVCPIAANAYVLVAKKRVSTLTPVGLRWQRRRGRVVNKGLVGTSTRGKF